MKVSDHDFGPVTSQINIVVFNMPIGHKNTILASNQIRPALVLLTLFT